jgi:hypothetical protein
MNRTPITTRTRVADALASSPHAMELFRRYGFDPTLYCGPTAKVLTLGEAVASCGLPNTQQLIPELNDELDAADTQLESH